MSCSESEKFVSEDSASIVRGVPFPKKYHQSSHTDMACCEEYLPLAQTCSEEENVNTTHGPEICSAHRK